MRRILWIGLSLLCALPLAARALPQRTFVASNGADTNPCSLAAPCRSFGTAVAAVAGGGEVIVLDSAGYGAVTIAQSVSIIAPPGIYAGVSVFGSAGVTVDGAGIVVVLRGLSITYQGGSDGIDFVQGTSLHVENCVISGFAAGTGINVIAAGSRISVLDTIIRDGKNGIILAANLQGIVSRTRVERNSSEGIELLDGAIVSIEDSVIAGSTWNIDLFPLSFGGLAQVTVARTLITGGSYGIIAEPSGTFRYAYVTVTDSTITQAATAGIAALGPGGSTYVSLVRNQLMGNATALLADGPAATMILDGNAVTDNGVGVNRANSATINTRGNNTVNSNATETSGTPYTTLGGV